MSCLLRCGRVGQVSPLSGYGQADWSDNEPEDGSQGFARRFRLVLLLIDVDIVQGHGSAAGTMLDCPGLIVVSDSQT